MERRILWFDSIAGVVAGALMLAAAGMLAPLFGLPKAMLMTTATFNVAYGTFSFSLARRETVPRGLLKLLVVANFAWTVVCIGLAVRFAGPESTLGVAFILSEGLFVGVLAAVEARVFGFIGPRSP